jgi:hypothetical protein
MNPATVHTPRTRPRATTLAGLTAAWGIGLLTAGAITGGLPR